MELHQKRIQAIRPTGMKGGKRLMKRWRPGSRLLERMPVPRRQRISCGDAADSIKDESPLTSLANKQRKAPPKKRPSRVERHSPWRNRHPVSSRFLDRVDTAGHAPKFRPILRHYYLKLF